MQILCFPCNQFGRQEPWPESQIVNWVHKNFGIVESSGITFFKKADVKGPNTQPTWIFLKQFDNTEVSWNFSAHFVLNKEGKVVGRYRDGELSDIESTINEELSKTSGGIIEENKKETAAEEVTEKTKASTLKKSISSFAKKLPKISKKKKVTQAELPSILAKKSKSEK